MVSRTFIVSALFCFLSVGLAQPGPQCLEEVKGFFHCLRNDSNNSRPDFKKVKEDIEQCISKSGCSLKTPPAQNDSAAGDSALPEPFNDILKCFKSVIEKVKDPFVTCLKGKDPDFGKDGPFVGPFGGPPPPPPPGGPPPHPFEHPSPFGPPPPGGFMPQGGSPPMLFGGPLHHRLPSVEALSNICDNDPNKAQQLRTCFEELRNRHKPSKEQIKVHFDSMCNALPGCKSKLATCGDKLQKFGQAACECHDELRPKFEEARQGETSCAKLPKPPTPDNKPDCSHPPLERICEDGFDKFYERITKFLSTLEASGSTTAPQASNGTSPAK